MVKMQFYILSIFLFNEVSTDWCVVGRNKWMLLKIFLCDLIIT